MKATQLLFLITEMKEEDWSYLRNLDFISKPSSFDEVENTVTIPNGIFKQLKIYTTKELYKRPSVDMPLEDFKIKTPQYLILVRPKGESYLVDTQGYNYARYLIKITNKTHNPTLPPVTTKPKVDID